MSALAWVVAAAGASLSALAAVSDGALWSEAAASGTVPDRGLLQAPAPVVSRVVPERERAHRALAFARVLGHLVSGSAVALALGLDGRTTPQSLLMLAVAGLLTVALAESIARTVGDALGDDAGRRLQWFVRGTQRVLAPAVHLGELLDASVEDVVSVSDVGTDRRDEAAAQFREVITSEADVSHDERDLLLGIFEFGETTAEEVMVPRVDIIGIERDSPWSEVVDRVRSAQHSRVPVFEKTIDEIVGILYAKDLLLPVLADEEPEAGWQSLMRPPTFIPSAKRIADLLREFRANRLHIAIVADEYGGTAGLVTIEDVLEELVGEIRDEYDNEERFVETEGDTRYWVSGRMNLDDLSEALAHDFRREDVATVGGLIFELVGRVPRAGESLTIGPFRVVVERVVRRKVERVFLERTSQVGESED